MHGRGARPRLRPPYGGSETVAAVILASIYLFLVQMVTLVGYVLSLRIAARGGHPLAG